MAQKAQPQNNSHPLQTKSIIGPKPARFQPNPVPESTTFGLNLVSKPARFQPNMALESTTSAQIQENSPRFCSHEGLTDPKTGQVSVKPGTRIDHLQPKPGIKTRQVSTRPGTRINQLVRVPVSRSTIPTTEGDIFTVQLWHSKVTELQLVDSCLIVALQGFKGTGLEIFHIPRYIIGRQIHKEDRLCWT